MRIGHVFSVRWVASSFNAVSAVWDSFPALAAHFRQASDDSARDGSEKAKFQGLLTKLSSINFVKSLAVMADVLTELKNLSEILQTRSITLPKAHDTMVTYVTRIGSLRTHPGKHELEASQAENEMNFQGVELHFGKNPVINSAQFIQAVVDLLKEKLFTTAANKSQSNLPETRKEAYN